MVEDWALLAHMFQANLAGGFDAVERFLVAGLKLSYSFRWRCCLRVVYRLRSTKFVGDAFYCAGLYADILRQDSRLAKEQGFEFVY